MRQLALCCLIFPLLIFAAKKEQHWKTGKVVADSTISSSEYTKGATGPHRSTVDPHILIIRGDDYVYTAQEKSAWNGWCLLFQGEAIKYAQYNRSLYVVDADGDKCNLDIMSQEKRPSP
jgi:hypothetical protein